MYYPAPGHQHVKVLVPRATFPKVARMPAARAVPENPMAPLVRQALEASFGQRDPGSLTGALFDMGVRSHVRYRRRLPLPAGHVQEVTSHAREGGEFFGTVEVGGRRYAWAARMHAGRLVSFKVL